MSVYLAVGKNTTTVSEGGLKIRKLDETVSAGTGSELDCTRSQQLTQKKGGDSEGGESKDEEGKGGGMVVPPQWASWVGRTTMEVSPWA